MTRSSAFAALANLGHISDIIIITMTVNCSPIGYTGWLKKWHSFFVRLNFINMLTGKDMGIKSMA